MTHCKSKSKSWSDTIIEGTTNKTTTRIISVSATIVNTSKMARTKQTARQTGGKAPWSFHTKPPPKGQGKGRKGARAPTKGETPVVQRKKRYRPGTVALREI